MNLYLSPIVESLQYDDLPEEWRVPTLTRFSAVKSLYDYQQDALKNAAKALYLYCGGEKVAWHHDENGQAQSIRKREFAHLYSSHGLVVENNFSVLPNRGNENIFRILSSHIAAENGRIPYRHFINRMCFWMATGSGKTLVMVKMIEYLHRLIEFGKIPPHRILILAPSEHLIEQIRNTVDEFNATGGLQIRLTPLKENAREGIYQPLLGDELSVCYYRSDNISDAEKDALLDYRIYENSGRWYVLLDEAHKGDKDDSKRQAYYALMARNGFLFNFSATFTDEKDIATTVYKYNLANFIRKGHGKNIFVSGERYGVFRKDAEDLTGDEKQKVVLMSLVTLAFIKLRVDELRYETGRDDLYHRPLMLTLVNSVNTEIANDLWAFFQTLRGIASGEIADALLEEAKDELRQEWREGKFLYDSGGGAPLGGDEESLMQMTVAQLRGAIFHAQTPGALQVIESKGARDSKELAFKLQTAEKPFALIRIGDISPWRSKLLRGFDFEKTLREKSYFADLNNERSPVTILMGSRSFFESWDSNRPNVINFINIGGNSAHKFIVQSVGRGVRIEPLPGMRKRAFALVSILKDEDRQIIESIHDMVAPPETLFLFPTNQKAINSVLTGLNAEEKQHFEMVGGFSKSKRPLIDGQQMPLLVPEYKSVPAESNTHAKFALAQSSLQNFQHYLQAIPDSILLLSGISGTAIDGLRNEVGNDSAFNLTQEKEYSTVTLLRERLINHINLEGKNVDSIRPLSETKDGDIVHFRHISAAFEDSHRMAELREKIKKVGHTPNPEAARLELTEKLQKDAITIAEFQTEYDKIGDSEDLFAGLKIKHVVAHYYVPMIVTEPGGATDFIKHNVSTDSEVRFIKRLDKWLGEDGKTAKHWDGWMFSKLDESLDKVHIPYYDSGINDYRRFHPDFVFWMSKGDDYRIVFVDPKGTAYAATYNKIDGYRHLFENDGKCRTFNFHGRKVTVRLMLFNKDAKTAPGQAYRHHWIDEPAAIFGTTVDRSRYNVE